jgi:hypothetical protein
LINLGQHVLSVGPRVLIFDVVSPAAPVS